MYARRPHQRSPKLSSTIGGRRGHIVSFSSISPECTALIMPLSTRCHRRNCRADLQLMQRWSETLRGYINLRSTFSLYAGAVLAPLLWGVRAVRARGLQKAVGHRNKYVGHMYKYTVLDIKPILLLFLIHDVQFHLAKVSFGASGG